jgi:hypothetical protein
MQNDLNILIKATLNLYLKCFFDSCRSLYRNWITGILWLLLYSILFPLLTIATLGNAYGTGSYGIGMIGGVIITLIRTYLISLLYKWIIEGKNGINNISFKKIPTRDDLKSLFQIDQNIFWGVITIGFIFWIVSMIVNPFIITLHSTSARSGLIAELLYTFMILIAFNTLPETMMSRKYTGLQALSHSWSFLVENWLEWFLALIIVGSPVFIYLFLNDVSSIYLLEVFAGDDILYPVGKLVSQFSQIVTNSTIFRSLIGSFFGIWLMYFRIHLFVSLDESSRRKRIFMNR